jgi:Rps23 Pro-64 3,4-dihydroxylase Tpa1-like proline 4-hydroxylase
MVNIENITNAFKDFNTKDPFRYCVIDNFLKNSFAEAVANEFPSFDSNQYNGSYNNQIELKKTCNIWDKFLPNTYKLLSYLNSPGFVNKLSLLTGVEQLYADAGLHGGGQHTHPPGGKLNPHLDYNIHPKLGLQRKFNLLIYLTPDWNELWGGDFGLWNSDESGPTTLNTTVPPLFNRAVFFDTTMNSWHGLATKVTCPAEKTRNSIAVYYLTLPPDNTEQRHRAKFAPTEEQKNNTEILELIERRSTVTSTNVEDWDRK